MPNLFEEGEFDLDLSCVKNRGRELKSNHMRPPRPKGTGYASDRTPPGFRALRNHRVTITQISLICTICFIDLEGQKMCEDLLHPRPEGRGCS